MTRKEKIETIITDLKNEEKSGQIDISLTEKEIKYVYKELKEFFNL